MPQIYGKRLMVGLKRMKRMKRLKRLKGSRNMEARTKPGLPHSKRNQLIGKSLLIELESQFLE
jgi:hypothetical protein